MSDDQQDTGAGAAPETAQHLDDAGNVDFIYRVDPDTDGGGQDHRPRPSQDHVPDPHRISVSPEIQNSEDSEFDPSFAAIEKNAPDVAAALKAEWGDGKDFQGNFQFAKAAFDTFATPEIIAAFDASGLSEDPGVIKALASIGRQIALEPGNPDTVQHHGHRRAATMDKEAKELLREKIDSAHAQQYGTEKERREYRSPRFQRELQAMHAELHGDEPIVGTMGRVA